MDPLLDIQSKPSQRKQLSSLPLVRFTTLATVLVALDSLVTIVLWLAGGNSQYLEHSVKDFSFLTSTFDLVCLAVVRGVLFIACLYYLEHYTLVAASSKLEKKSLSSKKLANFCHAILFILSLVSFAYAVVKGSFILAHLSEVTNQLHITYKILCVVAVAVPLLEVAISISSIFFMWRLTHVLKLRMTALSLNEVEGTDGEPKKSKANLRRIALLAVPEYPIIFLGFIMLLLSSGGQAGFPYFFGSVIDLAVKNTTLCRMVDEGKVNASNASDLGHCTLDPMNREVLILVALFMGASIAAMVRNMAFSLAGERFVARLRKNLFGAIVRQEMGFFDMNRTGELTNRLASDTQVIQSAVTENISILIRQLLQIVLSLGIMFWISPKLTAVLLAVVPIIAVGAVQYGRFLKSLRKRFQDKLALANNTAEETISNMRTVRAFTNEEKMKGLYDKDINSSYFLGRKIAFLQGGFMGVVFPLIYGAATLVLWYGGFLVNHGELSPGKLTSLMLYTLTLATSFAFLANVYGEFMQAVGASVRLFELMDRQSKVLDGHDLDTHFKGEIEFRDVEFNYPSRQDEVVLKGVSLKVTSGQVVALVGPSGGGKSTIVNLIEHFYNADAGQVFIGGTDVRDLDPQWYRSHIGIVSQEPILFACSIRDNIAFGREGATQEEVEAAARQANAHEFITSFEEGYDTLVGERGIRLSGGQKQRVAIARALLLNPTILLLDEATSALDAESEHLVQEAIDRAMKGRTVLVIAHRLSTVRTATKVIVLDKGRVVEQGTHDELLAMDGVYKRLVLRQLAAAENGVAAAIEPPKE